LIHQHRSRTEGVDVAAPQSHDAEQAGQLGDAAGNIGRDESQAGIDLAAGHQKIDGSALRGLDLAVDEVEIARVALVREQRGDGIVAVVIVAVADRLRGFPLADQGKFLEEDLPDEFALLDLGQGLEQCPRIRRA